MFGEIILFYRCGEKSPGHLGIHLFDLPVQPGMQISNSQPGFFYRAKVSKIPSVHSSSRNKMVFLDENAIIN
jgi:hypothetical protein